MNKTCQPIARHHLQRHRALVIERLEQRCTLSALSSAEAGLQYLDQVMDQYHSSFSVYQDISSAGDHFHARQELPDQNGPVDIDGSSTIKVHSGATSIRNQFRIESGKPYGGFYFQNGVLQSGQTDPQLNFGTVPNAGYDLSGATSITF